jgi:hypothetical protein
VLPRTYTCEELIIFYDVVLEKDGCMDELLQAFQKIDPDKEETVVHISADNCSKLCESNPRCAAATYATDLRKCYQHFEAVPERVNLNGYCLNHYIKPQGCEKVGEWSAMLQKENYRISSGRPYIQI